MDVRRPMLAIIHANFDPIETIDRWHWQFFTKCIEFDTLMQDLNFKNGSLKVIWVQFSASMQIRFPCTGA